MSVASEAVRNSHVAMLPWADAPPLESPAFRPRPLTVVTPPVGR